MSQTASVFSVRVSPELKQQLETVAEAMDRPRSWVVTKALEEFVAQQQWQIEETRKGLAEADAGDFASDKDVTRTFAKWNDAD